MSVGTLLTEEAQPPEGVAIQGQKSLGCIIKAAEQAPGEQVSKQCSFTTTSVLVSSFCLTSPQKWRCKMNKPFLPQDASGQNGLSQKKKSKAEQSALNTYWDLDTDLRSPGLQGANHIGPECGDHR